VIQLEFCLVKEFSMCLPRPDTQAERCLRHCFYCTINQLLIHLVPFVGDALLFVFFGKWRLYSNVIKSTLTYKSY